MENATKFLTLLITAIFLMSFAETVKAQGYRNIVPLQSNCEDVKKMLNVNNCSYPVSKYDLKDSFVYIYFTKESPDKDDRTCWKVPDKSVLSIRVIYRKAILLSEFEPEIKFVEGPIDDIFTMVYKNEEDSLEAHVIGKYITELRYEPTKSDRESKSYYCKSSDAGDDFETPIQWVERFWNISEKLKNQVLLQTIKVFRESPLNKEIYVVYYHKNDKDRAIGIKRAAQIKFYLEKNGIISKKIKVFNGGRESKSELVIYINK